MIGEGEYNLNALREIRVTKSFLEMEEMDRGCQIVETIQDCSTRHHINSLTEECICLPLSLGLQLFEKVCDDRTIDHWGLIVIFLFPKGAVPLCTSSSQLECVNQTKVASSACLPPCSGLIITSFAKLDGNQNFESLIPDREKSYRNVTKWSKLYPGMEGLHPIYDIMYVT